MSSPNRETGAIPKIRTASRTQDSQPTDQNGRAITIRDVARQLLLDSRPETFPSPEEIDQCLERNPDLVKFKLQEYERDADREAAKKREKQDRRHQSPERSLFGFFRKSSNQAALQAAAAADLMSEDDDDYAPEAGDMDETETASGAGLSVLNLTEELTETPVSQSGRKISNQNRQQPQSAPGTSQPAGLSEEKSLTEMIHQMQQQLAEYSRQTQDMENMMLSVASQTDQSTKKMQEILTKERTDRQLQVQQTASEAAQFCGHNAVVLEEKLTALVTDTAEELSALIGQKISEIRDWTEQRISAKQSSQPVQKQSAVTPDLRSFSVQDVPSAGLRNQSAEQTQMKQAATPVGIRTPVQRTRSKSSPLAAVKQVLFTDDGPNDHLKRMKLLSSVKGLLPKYGGEEYEDFDMFERELKQCMIVYPIPEDQLIACVRQCFPEDSPALYWYKNWIHRRSVEGKTQPDLTEILTALKKKFADTDINEAEKAKELQQRRLEKADDYVARKILALRKVNITDKKSVIAYLEKGVHDRYRKKVQAMKTIIMKEQTLDAALELFTGILEDTMKAMKDSPDDRSVFAAAAVQAEVKAAETGKLMETLAQVTQTLDAMTRAQDDRRLEQTHRMEQRYEQPADTRTCYICGQVGHISTFCGNRQAGRQGGRGRGRLQSSNFTPIGQPQFRILNTQTAGAYQNQGNEQAGTTHAAHQQQ